MWVSVYVITSNVCNFQTELKYSSLDKPRLRVCSAAREAHVQFVVFIFTFQMLRFAKVEDNGKIIISNISIIMNYIFEQIRSSS